MREKRAGVLDLFDGRTSFAIGRIEGRTGCVVGEFKPAMRIARDPVNDAVRDFDPGGCLRLLESVIAGGCAEVIDL
ncbi:MAG TPA: hypothetical protein VJ717_18725, partial [Gemmatimonadaceae bacterium]|nr:hypothetical protein [Gemmatimonadaceae bacterium]